MAKTDELANKRMWVAIETKRLSMEDRQTRQIHDALRDSIQPVLTRLREQGPQDAIDDIESEINDNPIEDAYKNLYAEVGVSFAMDTFEGLISQKQEQTLEDIWMEELREFAAMEAGSRIAGVASHTVDKVREDLENGIQQGWGTEKIARQLESSDAISRTRGRRIARTEIVTASNEGSMIAARSTGLNLRKQWLATYDGRVRQTHAVTGTNDPVDTNESFRVGGYEADYPGDPSLPASESINCRCAIAHATYDSPIETPDRDQALAHVERMRDLRRNRGKKKRIVRSRMNSDKEQKIRDWLNNVRNKKLDDFTDRQRRLLDNWVRGSKRKVSIEMKEAAIREFDLDGVPYSTWDPNLSDDIIAQTQDDLRSMYRTTQNHFRKQGQETVTLYRGVKSDINQPGALSSWSTDRSIAEKFDGHDVIEREVPVENILTGRGVPGWIDGPFGNQKEMIVLQ